MMKTLKNEIIEWNSKFPVDRWWRLKHNVPYMSKQHREASFIDMLFEFEEEMMFNELDSESTYTPNTGNWLNTSGQTENQKITSLVDEFRKDLEHFD